MTTITLQELAAAWRAAKVAEVAATEERRRIEEEMLALMPHKDEGSVTQDGVTATYKMTRKVDTDALQADWNKLTDSIQQCFRWKADVDTKTLRAVQQLDSDAYRIAANYITTTPAKPAITIKD